MRQAYNITALQAIANKFNTGKIRKHSLFTSGFENSNYYLETEKGRYVVKIFEGIGVSQKTILFEIEVMIYCFQHGMKTPVLLASTNGEYYTLHEGKIGWNY